MPHNVVVGKDNLIVVYTKEKEKKESVVDKTPPI